ncbi:Periplasmic beta-glucosidase precursor [Rubripirellula amarantea]|uniref:beta-glucosidase n=1 Tax=Rubripirellula amarantea TaxID=2527999 RepID=A0A5C5WWZ1_9BACT|nr:beta-glucosidase BglX [Rubripirellula amarantea]TWT55118.1 Periplasmic beta-glucosidase precursor [Rubripirellula amarantea]
MNIDDLIAQMTLTEKIGQLNLVNPGGQTLTGSVANSDVHRKLVDGQVGMMFGTASLESRCEIQSISVNQTRLGIPMLFACDVIHGYRTALPLPIALSCTWNLAMIERAAHLSATEARADGIDLTFGPMADLTRDPRWGRVAEGNGESATLSSWITAAVIRGYQGDGETSQPSDIDRMLACVKHFAGYGAVDGGREYASVNLGPIELHESHLPPFEAATCAKVAAVMPGFHALDRIPVTAHRDLLIGVLRERWNFEGAVISDYTAINELEHHGLGDLSSAAVAAINAGVDVDMVGESYITTLEQSVASGRVDVARIDAACRSVLKLKRDAGLFDDPFRALDPERAKQVLGCDAHRNEARQMAAASCVLLKNKSETLPIGKECRRIALIGPLADDRSNLPGTWSVSAIAEECVSLADGLRSTVCDQTKVVVARGCNLVDDPVQAERLNVFGTTVTLDSRDAQAMIDEAVAVARDSDVVVLALGEAKEHAGECSSRTDLQLPPPQRLLIDAVADLGVPIVLLVFAGRPLVLTGIADRVNAMLYAWYGGSMAGPGIADVLTGSHVPEGKLTMSLPRSVGQIPVHHDALPTGRPLPPDCEFMKFKSCYLDEQNDPLYPFGFGLSYTTFAYRSLSARTDSGRVIVSVEVKNEGQRRGVEIVQCYQLPGVCSVSQPLLSLKSFERVQLEPGETRLVEFVIDKQTASSLEGTSLTNVSRGFIPGLFRFAVGPNSQDLQHVQIDWR